MRCRYGFAPYAAGFEHVCLVYRAPSYCASSLSSLQSTAAGDALHFKPSSSCRPRRSRPSPMLSSLQAAGGDSACRSKRRRSAQYKTRMSKPSPIIQAGSGTHPQVPVHLRSGRLTNSKYQCGARRPSSAFPDAWYQTHIVPPSPRHRTEQNGIRAPADSMVHRSAGCCSVDRAATREHRKLNLWPNFADLIEHEHSARYDFTALPP